MWRGQPREGPALALAVTGWGLFPCNDTQPTVIDRPRAMHPSNAKRAEPHVGPPLWRLMKTTRNDNDSDLRLRLATPTCDFDCELITQDYEYIERNFFFVESPRAPQRPPGGAPPHLCICAMAL